MNRHGKDQRILLFIGVTVRGIGARHGGCTRADLQHFIIDAKREYALLNV